MVNYLLSMSHPPQVLSTSYLFNERDLDHGAASNLCNAYMQLGARGVSIVWPQSPLNVWSLILILDTLFSSLHRAMEVSPEFNLSRALPLCESLLFIACGSSIALTVYIGRLSQAHVPCKCCLQKCR